MNHSPFWPLVWKEYRVSRGFWLSMAAIGLVAQTSAFWLMRRSADRDWWLFGLALITATGFAVGVGGTLFAVEHEDRTFGLLRKLPLRARELGTAKLLSALAGIVSLVAALWLTASLMAGWQALSPPAARQMLGFWGLSCAEGLGWGILCSLVIRSPLRATLLALVAVSLVDEIVEVMPIRLALLALVVAADVWLLPRWLAGQYPMTTRPPRRPAKKIPGDRCDCRVTWLGISSGKAGGREDPMSRSCLFWRYWAPAC
jgi:ABC-type transport system involved in multi-copper enzyme maturation permease subunit